MTLETWTGRAKLPSLHILERGGAEEGKPCLTPEASASAFQGIEEGQKAKPASTRANNLLGQVVNSSDKAGKFRRGTISARSWFSLFSMLE